MAIELVRFNRHGAGWRLGTENGERFAQFRVYAEGGNVQAWAELRLAHPEQDPEALQYLEPWQAVRVGLGFIRAAFVAVWQRR